ncbi:MAG: hypothetical protein HYW24_03045 [Candidatus Aenigmarchaeota archaeon]|nr:hypothetical protein [Candidatus Aenigmarchaeota archaeon]
MKGISEIIATILMLIVTMIMTSAAYFFIYTAFTQEIQGIEILDAFCLREDAGIGNSTMTIRNIGSNEISTSAIIVRQISPSTVTDPRWSSSSIASGDAAMFYDECEGSGGRVCTYRIIPPVGRSVTGFVSCT